MWVGACVLGVEGEEGQVDSSAFAPRNISRTKRASSKKLAMYLRQDTDTNNRVDVIRGVGALCAKSHGGRGISSRGELVHPEEPGLCPKFVGLLRRRQQLLHC